jgi:hypothetical protein
MPLTVKQLLAHSSSEAGKALKQFLSMLLMEKLLLDRECRECNDRKKQIAEPLKRLYLLGPIRNPFCLPEPQQLRNGGRRFRLCYDHQLS